MLFVSTHVVAMGAFGAFDQIYHILGKAYVGSIDSDGLVMKGVDCSSTGDMLPG